LSSLEKLLANPRITLRQDGLPDPQGGATVYWMQRAQRGVDNPALDVAIQAANALRRPVAVFFGLHPKYPNANTSSHSKQAAIDRLIKINRPAASLTLMY
jgi:hypothetical protein